MISKSFLFSFFSSVIRNLLLQLNEILYSSLLLFQLLRCSRFQQLTNCLLIPPINLLSISTTNEESITRDTYKLVLQWIFASASLLWQIGDMLSRSSWTSKDFRFQNFIELFEKQPQKVKIIFSFFFLNQVQNKTIIRMSVGSVFFFLLQ